MRTVAAVLPTRRHLLTLLSVAALLVALLPSGADAVREVDTSGDLVTSIRFNGADRFDTSGLIADDVALVADPSTSAILATGRNFPDALAGAYLSGVLDGAPVLLTEVDSVPAATTEALVGVETVYLLGGPVAISDTVANQLAADHDVVRIAGADRFATAAEITTSLDTGTVGTVDGLPTAVLAAGRNFPDALVAGAASRNAALPLLLTEVDTVPAVTLSTLEDLGVQQVILAGGPVAISGAVATSLSDAGYQVRRIAGENRDATAVAFARFNVAELGFTTNKIGLSRNDNFPDALAFAPLAGREGFSIALSPSAALSAPTADYFAEIAGCQFDALYVAGGPTAISDATEQAARQALTASDCGGVDNLAPTLVSARFVELNASAGRTPPAAGDDRVQVVYDEPVLCGDDAPEQFTYTSGDNVVTATSVECNGSSTVTLGFPGGSITDTSSPTITYLPASNPSQRVTDLFGNEAPALDTVTDFALLVPAETLDVNTTDDKVDAAPGDGVCETSDDGECSLRAAIMEANADPNLTQVNVPAGTYQILRDGRGEDGDVTGDLDITEDLLLVGADGAIVDGNGLDRVFDVFGADVEIQGLTIIGGDATGSSERGGGLRLDADSDVTISDSVFDDNTAAQAGGAIENTGGVLTTSDTDYTDNATGTTPGNGGAVHAAGGTTTISGGTASGNSAVEGGAHWIGGGGTMAVVGATVTGNDATGGDATAGDRQGGGGLFNVGGTLHVVDATITGNTAVVGAGSGGGIMTTGDTATLTVDGSTISGNVADRAGGGIEVDGSTATLGATAPNMITGNTATGTNSAGNGGGVHAIGALTVTGDTIGANSAEEGGGVWIGAGAPLTITGATIQGNTALGGDATAGSRQGGGGVFSTGSPVTIAGSTIEGNNADAGAGSGGGIMVTDAGTLTLDSSTVSGNVADRAGGGIELDGSTGTIGATSPNDITGNTATGTDSAGNGGGLHATADVTVSGGNVSGNTAQEGGGLWIGGSGTLTSDATVQDNTADGTENADAATRQGGGGYFNAGATLTITGGLISNNTATTTSGGGIMTRGATGVLNVDGAVIQANTADRAGGGIENDGSTADIGTVSANSIISNTATAATSAGNGGGIHAGGGTTTIGADGVVNTIDGNFADEGGGFWNSGTATVEDASITANVANGNVDGPGGGGLFNTGGASSLSLTDVTVGTDARPNLANSTTVVGSGGGLFVNAGDVTIVDSVFEANEANRAGGGIELAAGAGTVTISGTDFFDNVASGSTAPGNGGAIHTTNAPIQITGGTVDGNVAVEGGGFWNGTALMAVDGTTFTNNVSVGVAAGDGGGALFNNGGTLDVDNATIGTAGNGNVAEGAGGANGDASGGGILTNGGTLTVDDTVLEANTARRAGGGIETVDTDVDLGVDGPVSFVANDVSASPAPGNGGGIHQVNGTVDATEGVTFTGNLAVEGGGAWVGGTGIMTFDPQGGDPIAFTSNVATGGASPNLKGGGALFNSGATLNVVGAVTFTGNTATAAGGSGGAILSANGATNVGAATFIGNLADRAGGAVEVDRGAYTSTGATYTDNRAEGIDAPGNGGAVHNGGGIVTVNGGTASGNIAVLGGAFWTNAQFTVNGTDVGGASPNQATEGGAFYNTTGASTTGNFDFINVVAADGGEEVVSAAADAEDLTSKDDGAVIGNVYAVGGPAPTASAQGSIFTDFGVSDDGVDEATCETLVDPEGDTGLPTANNDDDGTCFGVGAGTIFLVNTTTDAVDADLGDGVCDIDLGTPGEQCSLRAAIQTANTDTNSQTILFDGAVFAPGTITLTVGAAGDGDAASGDLDITEDLEIEGLGAGSVVISADGLGDRVFDISGAETDVRITDVTIRDGTANATPDDRGGNVRLVGGTLNIADAEVNDGTAPLAGGGIENTNGVLTLVEVDMSGNVATGVPVAGNGGAVHQAGGQTTIQGGTFDGNTAVEGGGLWVGGGGTMNVQGETPAGIVTISNNVATGGDTTPENRQGGGGVFNDGANLSLTDVTITGNTANTSSGSGGGVMNKQGEVTITGGLISGNTADRAGGGIENDRGTATVTDVIVSGNQATGAISAGNGGGLHAAGGTTTVSGGTYGMNDAAEGGGLWIGGAGTLTSDADVTGNTANGTSNDPGSRQGGGGYFNDGATLTITGGTVSNNTATTTSGGGIMTTGGAGVLTVDAATIQDNTADRAGGGVEVDGGTADLGVTTVNIVSGNVATGVTSAGNGGGVHNGAGVVTLGATGVVSAFTGNGAVQGGALWTNNPNPGSFTVVSAIVTGNQAEEGGAFYNAGGDFVFTDVDATDGGEEVVDITAAPRVSKDAAAVTGNVYAQGALGNTVTVTGSTFTDPTAESDPGGPEDTCEVVVSPDAVDNTDDDGTCFGAGAGTEFEVNSVDDNADADLTDGICADALNQCTLRAAVQQSNVDAATQTITFNDGVFAGPGPNLILLTGTAGEDDAASGDLDITDAVDIVADPGESVVVDGDFVDRVFDAFEGPITFTGIDVENGDAGTERGGGLRVAAGVDVVINGGRFTNNFAGEAGGAIENAGGTVSATNTDFLGNVAQGAPGNGGAIHVASGDTTITGGLVEGNTAAREGGGFWNQGGTMTVDGTTFTNNAANGPAADDGGGALFNQADGAGVGTLVVRGATIGDVVLVNSASTGSGSGGGILVLGGILTVENTLFDGNTAARAGGGIEFGASPSGAQPSATLTNVTFSGNTTGSAPGNGGAIHVTSATTVDIIGGLVVGNTAAREGGGFWNQTGTMTVDGTMFANNVASGTAADDGGGALFNQADGAGNGTLVVRNAVVGTAGAGNAAIAGSGSGGGILNLGGVLTVEASTIDGNGAARAGGGIELAASPAGQKGSATITGTDFNGNTTGTAPGNGGAIHVTAATTVDITNGTVDGNTAAREGGGFWNQDATMTVTGTVFTNNVASGTAADDGGGALFNQLDGDGTPSGTLVVADAVVGTAGNGNTATAGSGSGGGIQSLGGTLTVTNSSFTDNAANRAGGGIESDATTTTVTNSTFTANVVNTSPGNGGGIHGGGMGMITVTDSDMTGNSAGNEGGALWASAGTTMPVSGGTYTDNTAPFGGAFFNDSGTMSFTNVIATATTAGATMAGGGHVFADDGGGTVDTSAGGNDFQSPVDADPTCTVVIGLPGTNTDDDMTCFNVI